MFVIIACECVDRTARARRRDAAARPRPRPIAARGFPSRAASASRASAPARAQSQPRSQAWNDRRRWPPCRRGWKSSTVRAPAATSGGSNRSIRARRPARAGIVCARRPARKAATNTPSAAPGPTLRDERENNPGGGAFAWRAFASLAWRVLLNPVRPRERGGPEQKRTGFPLARERTESMASLVLSGIRA